MSSGLDMSLDDLIKQSKSRPKANPASSSGPARRAPHPARAAPYPPAAPKVHRVRPAPLLAPASLRSARSSPRGDSGSGGAGRVPPRQLGSASGDAGGSRGRGARRRREQDDADDSMPPPQVPNKLDRAQWSAYHTKLFCQLYCDQIDLGYCNRGQMTKWGWRNITEEYFKRTKLVHDNVIFGNKVRALKKEWRAIRDLQIKETGLGRSADGSINASDQWWEENSEDHQKDLKDGLPDYLPELDKMFQGVCVTGETSYVPGRRNGPHNISSDDEDNGGDTTPHSTPQSTGSKRSSSSISTRSTGTSPNKKSRSPALRAMQANMRDLNVLLENRAQAQHQIWADRQKREDQLEENKRARRKRVREMATQLGVTGNSRLWVGVLKLVRSEEDMESFEDADEEGRKCILAHLAGEPEQPSPAVNADAVRKQQWEQDFFAMLAEEDDDEIALIYGTLLRSWGAQALFDEL